MSESRFTGILTRTCSYLKHATLLSVVLAAGIVLGSPEARASHVITNGCMQDIAGFALGCTANDVQIAEARNVTLLDDGCAYLGDTVDFAATFDVVVTAKERFDIGLYFATDGDVGESVPDGAISGQCVIATIPPLLDSGAANPDFVDLDDYPTTNDSCGDITKKSNPLQPTIEFIGVKCIDPDGDGKLNLPNCTSWRQSGANDLCTSPLDAFPGSPSKCNCDQNFNIDIDVPPAQLTITKTATPDSVPESGANVSFEIKLTNPGVDPNNTLTINSFTDSVFNLASYAGSDPDCATPIVLAGNGGTATCSFTAYVSGNVGVPHVNTASASGVDDNGNTLSGSASAQVDFENETPTIEVTKTAAPTEVFEPGGDVTFTVEIKNTSVSSDPVTIADDGAVLGLEDSIYGDLNGKGNCSLPQTIQPGGTYSCAFTEYVASNSPTTETDIVTARGQDDDGTPVSGSDSATVTISDVPSAISMTKTPNPTSVDEPGGNVIFTFTVNNTSAVDTVTINSLTDSDFGDLNGQGDCSVPQSIVPGGSYSCAITAYIAGNPATDDPHMNVATASGVDDDGNPKSATADATVSFNNVAPAASLMKTATSVDVTYEVEVSNDSTAEALNLTILMDDRFGNLDGQGTCVVPQTIAVGDSYTCTFTRTISGPLASPHTNTVTGTIVDDEGSTPVTPSDSATVDFE